MVLMSHGRGLLMEYFPSLQLLKFGGFLGVELFFVLSGFLIGNILLKIVSSEKLASGWFVRFWLRRWLRTFPNYLLFLMINIFIINSVRPAAQPDFIRYITFTQNFLSPQSNFFGEAWSLSVEEIFYFITPLIITILSFFICSKEKLIITALAIIFSLSLLLRVYYSAYLSFSFDEIRAVALLRLDSIMFGVAGAWMYSRGGYVRHFFCKAIPVFLIFLPMVIYIASVQDSKLDKFYLKVFFFDLTSLVCLAIIISGLRFNFNHFFSCVFGKLARWSYSAYLTNLPVLYLLYYLFPFGTKQHNGLLMWLAYIFLTFIFSAFVYRFYETFFLKFRDKNISG